MKVLLPRLLVCVVVLTLLFSGCRKDKAGKTAGEQPGEKPSENVVAMIGDEAITEADLEATLKQLPERRRDMDRKRTIHYLVDRKIYCNEAKKMGLDEDPQVQVNMERAGKEILARNFVGKFIESKAAPSEEEIRKYYDEYTDQFVIPEGIMVRRIRVVKKEDAEAAVKALKGGTRFESVARQWSKLVRRNKRGEQEWLYRKRIDPRLEKAAFEPDVGGVSDIVSMGNEYQIVKILGKSEEKLVEFKQAKSKIRFRLLLQKKRKLIHDYYENANVDRTPGEGILVKVGDEVFKEDAIAHILAKVKEKEKEKFRRRWIEYFIETTVFSKEAEKVGLQNDPDVARQIRLKRENVLAKAYRERVVEERIKITDEDVAEEYEANMDSFKIPTRLRLRLIVVETRKEAEEILKEIKGGADFSYLAGKRSIHPSSQRGGELGWFRKGEKDLALEKAALALEKYEISDIIETERGYEIIRLMGKDGGVKPLEEVRQRIEMALQSKKMAKERQRYYEKAGVKVFNDQ